MPRSILHLVVLIQGGHFLLAGVRPVFSIETFERVTGRKTAKWLVKPVGVVVAVIGAAIGITAQHGTAGPEVIVLALASAA